MKTMRTLWIAVILVSSAFAQQEQKMVDNKANNGKIDYIEFPATDVAKTKAFYERAFGWKFTDYGPDYTSFEDGRIAGGFSKGRAAPAGGALIVIYATDLAGAAR